MLLHGLICAPKYAALAGKNRADPVRGIRVKDIPFDPRAVRVVGEKAYESIMLVAWCLVHADDEIVDHLIASLELDRIACGTGVEDEVLLDERLMLVVIAADRGLQVAP